MCVSNMSCSGPGVRELGLDGALAAAAGYGMREVETAEAGVIYTDP